MPSAVMGGVSDVANSASAFTVPMIDADGNLSNTPITVPNGLVRIVLPSSDPEVLNVLWNDAGTVKVSTGPPG